MTRVPKLGEVWVDNNDGDLCTCTDETPDDGGNYGWSWVADGKVRKAYFDVTGMTPPRAEPPEWVRRFPWMAVGPDGRVTTALFDAPLYAFPAPGAVGAINVLTGEWVPRD